MNDAGQYHRSPSSTCASSALAVAIPALAALMIGTAAPAQTAIETGNTQADDLIRDALAEQRIFMTCSALDPGVHEYLITNLVDMVANAATSMRAAGVPRKAIQQFQAAATPAALMPPPDTPFSDVLDMCREKPDWADQYARLDFILLDFRLRELFGQ